MFGNIFTRRYARVWTALAVIAVLALALSFPQVRAAANSFLGLFRVEKVTVPVDLSNPARTKSIYYFNSDFCNCRGIYVFWLL